MKRPEAQPRAATPAAPTPSPTPVPDAPGRTVWRTALAGGAGSVIEYYDFSLYANLAIYISAAFLSRTDPGAALLDTLAVFGSGFLMRPVGALFFGWLGDRHGRRTSLLVSVVLMGLASSAVGVLPTYAALGVVAPLLLLVLRLLQGFCAGGEASGASTYIAETAPAKLRGFFGAFNPAGIGIGTAAAGGLAALVSSAVGSTAMAAWGWRVPFLLSLPLSLAVLYLRTRLPESAQFARNIRTGAAAASPFRGLVQEWPAVVKLVVLSFSMTCTAYVGHVYLNTYLTAQLHIPAAQALGTNSLITVVFALLMPFAALTSDRFGRRRIYGAAMAGYVVLALPAFLWMAPGSGVPLGLAMAVSFVPWVFSQAVGYPLFTELFGSKARMTGVAFGFALGTILGGGFGPYIAQLLTTASRWNLAPAAYMAASALVGLLALLFVGRSRIDDAPAAATGQLGD
ncbi:MFS transporter [Sinomonas terrae]|uniref:MFS transporter n=1 Tax=Sinomonas terrae TaxID=2908838 RepID=A0ABS9TWB9_9MICC|nr:MFS transporter [Sinomonas terrae]MCH6468660.1 MFS transporter [Sinomonas terrae]